MKVASHQPCFLPWPGFWHKVCSVDRFILSAGVAWSKDGFINRIQHAGAWLALPVQVESSNAPIIDVVIADDKRRIAKTWKTVAQQTGPYRSRLTTIIDVLQEVEPGQSLVEINHRLIQLLCGLLGVGTKITLDTSTSNAATKTERLYERLKRHVPGMTEYYLGKGALDYFDRNVFEGVQCFVQDPSQFAPTISILQLIANERDPVDVILSKGRWSPLD